jgi:hypothetical protein
LAEVVTLLAQLVNEMVELEAESVGLLLSKDPEEC